MKRKIKLSGSVEGLRSPLLRIFPAPVHNTRQGPPPSRVVILHAVPTRFYAALFALRQQWPQLKRAFKRLRRVSTTMNCLIPISDEGAAKARISGGKGANSHLLHRFSEMQAGFQVPSTSVLTTRLFTQLVMPRVRSQVRALGSLSGSDPHNPQREALCREIEEEILALSLPPRLEKRLGEEFERLGSDVAVRSSATCEDTSRYSAAGQGYTALHQTTLEGVISSIKKVWASLYSVGFTLYREESGYAHEKARMAVLLQAFVNSRAAGVVHSFDQGTGRPGYCISAQPGLGEGVVQPVGSVDHWFVGLLCEENDILERRIADKQRRIVIRPEGGTMEEGVCITDASLEDEMVLKIARVARSVRRHYVEERHAKDIDIEFAVDGQGQLFLVQARPKWLQNTANSKGELVVRVTTVDLERVPPETRSVQLSTTSVIAVEGAVTAILAVNRGAQGCRPGCVVVESHTNNEHNAFFASMAGVITSDGDQTSHAAQHAYEKHIPCVVAATGALETLAPYDGKVVTFDAGTRTVYAGAVPIREVERILGLWLTDPEKVRSFIDAGTRHEIFRRWSDSKAKRPAVFREDFEGHFRLRSNTYGHFQLDYYYQAWDRLTEILTGMFGHRTGRVLKTQARQIKAIGSGQCLVHAVKEDDPESIYHYLMSVDGFGAADLERLFEARLEGFRRFAAFVHDLHRIDKSNVAQVVDELVNVFAWMHCGFWLDAVVETFVHRQLRYIGNEGSFHNMLREEAVADMDSDFRVDPRSPWIPAGRLLNLSRQRDKEVFALIEHVRSNPELRAVFSSGEPNAVAAALEGRFPSEFETITDWSMKYKLTREDLDLPLDTGEYLSMLRKILDEDSSMPVAMLSVLYAEHLRKHNASGQKSPPPLGCLRRRDRHLYLLCRAHARTMIAKECQVPLSEVANAALAARLPEAVAALHARANSDMRFRQEAGAQVLHPNYPDLKAILRISRLQVVLREDGHHLIVPHQRRIARMMLDAAKDFVPRILYKPEQVFEMSVDEFVALFHEPDPAFIALGLKRRPKLLEAEQELRECWGVSKRDFADITRKVDRLWRHLSSENVGLINEYGALQDKCRALSDSRQLPLDEEFEPDREAIFAVLRQPLTRLASGLRTFECRVNQAIQVLEKQSHAAQLPRTQDAYRAEQARLKQRLNALKRKAISEGLAAARKLYAGNQQPAAAHLIDDALTDIQAILADGTVPEDPLLAYYYAARLMKKFVQVKSNLDAPEVPRRHMAQILVLNSTREEILLQQRGPYKRQFAGTYSVSANAKVRPEEDILDAAVRAVREEVGVDIERRRLKQIQLPKQPELHLTIASFYAFSAEEESRLRAAAQEYDERSAPTPGVVVRYNLRTRSLAVFSVDPKTGKEAVRATTEDIRDRTGVDYIFAFTNTDDGSLLVYQLNEHEETEIVDTLHARAKALKSALGAASDGLPAETLKVLDSDQMHFVPWIRARCESGTNPDAFTTVLTGPYFPDSAIWEALGFTVPELIQIDDPLARLTCVAGGKGSNLHVLRAMKAGGFRVPETSVLSTLVYEELVHKDPSIGPGIVQLDRETDPKRMGEIAQRIRERIMAVELPAPLKSAIQAEFQKLGGDLAVRSSATSEDLKQHQAAGQAISCLHQTTPDAVFNSIKRVWASLFADGFVTYRNSIGFPHGKARMAVLLQQFVAPRAAGVIFSFDQATGRPVYSISAQPGVGEGVVEGVGLADSWLVGYRCNGILQRKIPQKTVRIAPGKQGGVIQESIRMSAPSLGDQAVLDLAKAARKIHRHYRENGIADDVDIEYAIDSQDRIVIVQARAKPSGKTVNAEGKVVVRVRTVDETQVPAGTEVIRLDERSEIAVPGAIVSVLQLDPNREPTKCLPGRILVSHHTNNDYNTVFGSLDGLITTDGGQTSHAAQHAYEKKIPCVVGSIGALDLLKAHDGKQVTFDAGRRTLYLGVVPIIEEERVLDVWLTDEDPIQAPLDEGSRHENTRPWDISKRKRPKVFIEDPECHCRRRSNTYPYFQLDCFYRAWDRQAEILNRLFAGRSRFPLRPQARQIKVIEHKHQLVHIVADNDPASIHSHLLNVSNFGIDDLERLFDARLDGFRCFAEFVHSLTKIDASNVELLVDELLSVFSWMHFGFWLDSVVEEFASRQLVYISNDASFHNVLREESIRDLPTRYRVDPANPGVPAGKILNLTRAREKEIYALLERVRGHPAFFSIFESDASPDAVRSDLEARFPEDCAIIDRWSMRYKLTLEDIDVLSDTGEYIAEIRKKLRNRDRMPVEQLSNIVRTFLKVHGAQDDILDAAKKTDPDLYLLFRGLARSTAADAHGIAPEAVCAAEIDRRLPEVPAQLETLERSGQALRRVAAKILEQYPEIKRVLMVSQMQFPLREDAHHLIVPLQRLIAGMMIAAARPFVPSVLPESRNVFDLSLEEFVALLKEKDPGYVSLSRERWRILLDAEKKLQRTWTIDQEDLKEIAAEPEQLWADLTYENDGHGYIDNRGFIQDKFRALKGPEAMELSPGHECRRAAVFSLLRGRLDTFPSEFKAFEQATGEAVQLLARQIAAATIERVKERYQAEQARLKQRVEDFRSKLNNENRNPEASL